MPAVVIKINSAAVQEILKSPRVQADLAARAARIAQAANDASGLTDGHQSEVTVGRARAHGQVWTATADAMVSEAEDRTLTKSLDAGR